MSHGQLNMWVRDKSSVIEGRVHLVGKDRDVGGIGNNLIPNSSCTSHACQEIMDLEGLPLDKIS